MEFQDFLIRIEKYGFGIVACNTYFSQNSNYCYIMIAKRGNKGQFYKREASVEDLPMMLKYLYDSVIEYIDFEEENEKLHKKVSELRRRINLPDEDLL